jgi:Holliday junction resolvasome RuvABC endonuclease subunit
MMRAATELRVLALDPSTKGIGFAVMEGTEHLIDWGVKIVGREKNRECLRQAAELIRRYTPDVLVIEDHEHKSSRRSLRVRMLLKAILVLASKEEVKAQSVSRSALRKALSQGSALTKRQIAIEIAKRFPELAPRLPRLRKPWMGEDERMSIFDAVALAETLFYVRGHDTDRR